MKDPIWFECNKKILPEIHFYFSSEDVCVVKTVLGKLNSDVQKCLKRVKTFLYQKELADVKLVYLVHGFRGKDIENNIAAKDFKAIKNKLLNTYKDDGIVLGVVSWITGSRMIWPDLSKILNPGAGRSLFRTKVETTKTKTVRTEDVDNAKFKLPICCSFRAGKPSHKCSVYYPTAAANTWPIGNVLAYVNHQIVGHYNTKKKKISTFCIGHSLGSHLCGFFAKRAKELSSKHIVQKIIGLDPARPIFEDTRQDLSLKLNKEDASQVEIYHTNANTFGFQKPLGFNKYIISIIFF